MLLSKRFALLFLGNLLFANFCQADSFCFAQAQSYYEQIFCEVRAEGKGKQLPRFDEFRNNNPLTQALLLKRPARNSGIELVMPKAKDNSSRKVVRAAASVAVLSNNNLTNCEITGATIACERDSFQLLGNKANKHLVAGALAQDNLLNLPHYTGDISDSSRLYPYLLGTYRKYVNKMIDIGLGGATMSYGKFEYLFTDFHDKGIDFYQRFETMFLYLKKDKSTIGVSQSIAAPRGMALDSCGRLDQRMIACVAQGRNYLYAKHP